jgi:hypothetical protein
VVEDERAWWRPRDVGGCGGRLGLSCVHCVHPAPQALLVGGESWAEERVSLQCVQ